MEWAVYNVMLLLHETVQRENISIIIKIKTCSFEWCIVCLSNISLKKLHGKNQNLWNIPRMF